MFFKKYKKLKSENERLINENSVLNRQLEELQYSLTSSATQIRAVKQTRPVKHFRFRKCTDDYKLASNSELYATHYKLRCVELVREGLFENLCESGAIQTTYDGEFLEMSIDVVMPE